MSLTVPTRWKYIAFFFWRLLRDSHSHIFTAFTPATITSNSGRREFWFSPRAVLLG